MLVERWVETFEEDLDTLILVPATHQQKRPGFVCFCAIQNCDPSVIELYYDYPNDWKWFPTPNASSDGRKARGDSNSRLSPDPIYTLWSSWTKMDNGVDNEAAADDTAEDDAAADDAKQQQQQ